MRPLIQTRLLVFTMMLVLAALLISCRVFSGAASVEPIETRPSITSLSRNAASIGDQLTVIGTDFGASQSGSTVQLNSVDFQLNSWSDTRLSITVAAGMDTGTVVITCYGMPSQSGDEALLVIVDPIDPPADLSIISVIPDHAAEGDTVRIVGAGFGDEQGDSTIAIHGIQVHEVTAWAMNQIDFIVPSGATSGFLDLTVGGKTASAGFIIDYKPVIAGVAPINLRIGQTVTIYGAHFGAEQGSGQLLIEGTNIPIDQWQDDQIVVDALPVIEPADSLAVPVTVTNDAGLTSDLVLVRLASDLAASVVVTPRAGKANSPANQNPTGDGTEFSFNVDVAGGSGDYSFSLLEAWDDPSTIQGSTTISPVVYRFDNPGEYSTGMMITDNMTGDSIVVEGPIVAVADYDEPVITEMGISGFDNGGLEGPNDLSYYPDVMGGEPHYFDLVNDNGQPVLTSDLTDVEVNGAPDAGVARDLGSYFINSTNPRPVAYRYANGSSSRVGMNGFNFGDSPGTLYLRSEEPGDPLGYELSPTDIIEWSDEYIEFRLPADVSESFSGYIVVDPATSEKWCRSAEPLICSAYITSIIKPATVGLSSTITVVAYDLYPPVAAGLTGDKTYMIWWVNATYDDEFSGTEATGKVCAIVPLEVTGEYLGFNFNMNTLGTTREIEYFNSDLTAAMLGTGTLNSPEAPAPAAEYSFFLWTGALDPTGATVEELAHSGVFSHSKNLQIKGGGGGDIPPTAVLVADVTSGDAPLDVTFTLSGSSDLDGTIVQYEFDDGKGGGFVVLGAAPTPQSVTYTVDDNYLAGLRVMDNDGNTDTQTVLITCGDPPTTFTLEIGVSILTAIPQFGQPFELIRWNEGGQFMAFELTHETLGPLGTITCDTAGEIDVSGYAVFYGGMEVPGGFITLTPTLAPVGGWAIPLSGPPYSAAMFGDKTLANGDVSHFIDYGAFGP